MQLLVERLRLAIFSLQSECVLGRSVDPSVFCQERKQEVSFNRSLLATQSMGCKKRDILHSQLGGVPFQTRGRLCAKSHKNR